MIQHFWAAAVLKISLFSVVYFREMCLLEKWQLSINFFHLETKKPPQKGNKESLSAKVK